MSLAALFGGNEAAAQGRERARNGPGEGGPDSECTVLRWNVRWGCAEGRWWNDPAMVEKLKLSDDQRKAMDEILLEHREKLVDMRAAVEKAELEMEPLMQR